jgi:23S rRNA (uracil1939-C5)-methyltransferase
MIVFKKPVDLFSYTATVEAVVLLSHKNADTHINVNVEFGEGDGKIPVGKIAEKAEEYRPSERVTLK